ncbi:MAG TPA: hypothetical protein PL182_09620, partial [Pseudobdellovibrionaceae bacterium]|nr:hypothetical protein [Pseudobdellovibrionaceae bacterium]
LGNVSVSWFTLNYPTVGTGVVAHEIGHVVSRILRSQRKTPVSGDAFTESLNCVANRNPNQKFPVRLFGFQDTTWSEEDWADYFAALVITEMEKTNALSFRTKNLGCSLVMDLGDFYSTKQGIEPAKNDSHSSGLLRLLMTAVDKKEMTPQCQKLVDRFPKKDSPLSCH